jgi:hypothetical protein
MSVAPAVLQLVKAYRGVRTLSVYLDGSATDPAERNHWRVALVHEIARLRDTLNSASHAEHEAFDACAGRLMARLPVEGAMLGSPGWAGFASVNGDMHTEPLTAPVAMSVRWEPGLRIIPYLGVADPGPVVVVVADRQRATIYGLAGAELRELESLESEPHVEVGSHMGTTPRRGFHPGTRGEAQKDTAEREMRVAADRFVSETAARVRVRAGDHAWVVLGGAAEAVTQLAAALPQALAERTSISTSLHAPTPLPDVRRLAREALVAFRSARQRQLVAEVVETALKKSRATTGTEEVSHALALGAVELLLLSGSTPHMRGREAEELVRSALAEGAEVEVVAGAAAALLDAQAGGVAARLRFSTTTSGAPRTPAHSAAPSA